MLLSAGRFANKEKEIMQIRWTETKKFEIFTHIIPCPPQTHQSCAKQNNRYCKGAIKPAVDGSLVLLPSPCKGILNPCDISGKGGLMGVSLLDKL